MKSQTQKKDESGCGLSMNCKYNSITFVFIKDCISIEAVIANIRSYSPENLIDLLLEALLSPLTVMSEIPVIWMYSLNLKRNTQKKLFGRYRLSERHCRECLLRIFAFKESFFSGNCTRNRAP